MSKRFFVTCSFFAAVALAQAVPLFDQPVAEVHLTTGEVLYDAQAKGFNSTSVMMKYRDGAKTVPYDQFPAEWKTLVLARKPQPRVAPTKVATEVVTTDKPKKAALPDRLPGDRFKGLSLLSVNPGLANGYMLTEIYNDSNDIVSLDPGSLQAELDNGKIVNGRRWIDTDEEGKINVTLKSTQDLPPRETTALKVGFTVPPGVTITRVTWSKN